MEQQGDETTLWSLLKGGPDTHMCLWAWMIAFTSSELTMLSILLQKTPDAVGSSMASIKTGKLKTTVNREMKYFAAVFSITPDLRQLVTPRCASKILEHIHHCLLVVLHTAPHYNLHNTANYDKARHALKADGSCSVRKPVQLETSKDRTPQRTFKCWDHNYIVVSVRMIKNWFNNRAN